jgi:ATP-dependent DNA helicase PIF1
MNMDITLSTEQKALLKIMEETSQHLFITGRAGAGKSVLLREFRAQTKKRVMVCAPTGIAALNVKGQTIHSLFKLKGQLYDEDALTKLIPNSRLRTLLKRIDTVIVDEISMVRADLLDVIDTRLRDAHKNDIPFGGVQVIMFGDPYQLPPVVDEGLAPYFEAVHGGHYFFNALVWRQTDFKVFELTQVFRQKDPVFKDVLNAIRDGSVNDEQIAQLNKRYEVSRDDGIPVEGVVTLAPTNALVSQINQERLGQLKGKMRQYTADISGEMKKNAFPTEEHLQLKEGAQVVMLKNDPDGCWVNGTVGTVAELLENEIKVRIDGIAYALKKETWEETVYEYDFETKKVEMKVASSFTQFPVRLAFALTIHKSQGQTYERVAIDLTTAAFATGQMYVALSRCTSLEGLYLKMPVKRDSVMVDPKITAFMQRRETVKVVEEPQIVIEPVQQELVTTAVTIVPDIHHDEIELVPVSSQLHHDENALLALSVSSVGALEIYHDENDQEEVIIEATEVREEEPASTLVEGRVSRVTAIEVLCPVCNHSCVDPATGSPLITYELVGHTVKCVACAKACIVPLNAFSLQQSEVVAREQPAGQTTKREKVGRTKKERTSARGRKPEGKVAKEPLQLSLDVRVIRTLNEMRTEDGLHVNKSKLFVDLLEQYQPFLEVYASIELDHDENEG